MRLFASTWTTTGFHARASASSFASTNVAMMTMSPGFAWCAAAPLTQMTPEPAGASSAYVSSRLPLLRFQMCTFSYGRMSAARISSASMVTDPS